MGREEQVEEREVLDSIFPEEIHGKFVLATISATHTILNNWIPRSKLS